MDYKMVTRPPSENSRCRRKAPFDLGYNEAKWPRSIKNMTSSKTI